MALRDGYILDQVSDTIRDGYALDQVSDALTEGYDSYFLSQGVSLRAPRRLYGRRGVAVPTGVVLPEAKGGVAPYTYTVEDLPGGITFTAGTRTLSGTPSAAGEHTVTYKATDSSTPALEATKTFRWDNLDLLSTHGILLQDFDDGKVGYGVSDFTFAYAATLISGGNPGFSNVQVWASCAAHRRGLGGGRPIRASELCRPGASFPGLTIARATTPIVSGCSTAIEDLAGNPVDSDIGAWAQANTGLNLYLQRALTTVGVTLSFEDDIHSVGNWNATFEITAAQSTWIRANLAEDDQFILVIAEP